MVTERAEPGLNGSALGERGAGAEAAWRPLADSPDCRAVFSAISSGFRGKPAVSFCGFGNGAGRAADFRIGLTQYQ